jgi:hypothetical protein
MREAKLPVRDHDQTIPAATSLLLNFEGPFTALIAVGLMR